MKDININIGFIQIIDWVKGSDDIYPPWWDEEEDSKKEDPNEIILEEGNYTIVVNYPIERPYKKKVKVGSDGISRKALVDIAVESYKHVYSFVEGDEDSMNWNKYGIWGHSIGDLILHTFYIKDNVISLGIDS